MQKYNIHGRTQCGKILSCGILDKSFINGYGQDCGASITNAMDITILHYAIQIYHFSFLIFLASKIIKQELLNEIS